MTNSNLTTYFTQLNRELKTARFELVGYANPQPTFGYSNITGTWYSICAKDWLYDAGDIKIGLDHNGQPKILETHNIDHPNPTELYQLGEKNFQRMRNIIQAHQ